MTRHRGALPDFAFRVVLLLLGVGATVACDQRRPQTSRDSPDSSSIAGAAGAPADPDPEGAARAGIGVIFDPLALRAGDTVAGLVVERAEVRRAAADSTPVGSVAFRGPLTLTGTVIPHFDGDARAADGRRPACFEADAASAERLPRWAGDRRRPWLCFTNAAAARRALGAGDTVGTPPRHVRLEAFTINRGLSDEVNAARFVAAEPR
ncbi:MAG TPA: hypothetical protein VNA89_04290 [Gemmatimonadaceae bacterium]|nr:hypothetical protein [Gemmatimonadaceae bacterium]